MEEKLLDPRFAGDVALRRQDVKDMEHQLDTVNEERLNTGLKIHKGQTKSMTHIDTTDNIQINGTEMETVTIYTYLGQTMAMENNKRSFDQNKSRMECFGQVQRNLSGQAPSHEYKTSNQCALPAMTDGYQTWTLTKAVVKKLETSQGAMERKMLNVKLKDRIPNTIRSVGRPKHRWGDGKCEATGSGMDKDCKGQRKLGDSG